MARALPLADWPLPAKALLGLAAFAALALVWSVLASLAFLAAAGLLAPDTLPLGQFWLYLLHYGWAHPSAGGPLRVGAAVATALPLALGAAAALRGGWLGGGRPLHGDTRWASRREMEEAGLYAPFRGLLVGVDGRGRHLRFGGPEHVACYAPTRSGKGVGLVIPNCLLWDGSLVCLDVKGENWAASAGIRREAGQRVFLFDPLAPDGRTARYNPFTYVRRGTADAFEDVQRIAQMVFPHEGGDQRFWTDAARSAFVGAAGFLAETPELPLTFGEVLRLLSSADGARAMGERIAARRLAGRPYTEATVKALEDYLKGSADLVNSIRKTVTARLSLWFNPRVDAATADSDFDLRELRSALHAVYVGVTPDNIARLRPLLALFFQQLVDLSVRQAPRSGGGARHAVLLLLDEFPILGPMPVLADAFAWIAGYGVRIMLVMQGKAQLRDRDLYGPDKAEAILENCGLEVVFGTKDLRLSEELSARLGYATVASASRSGPRFWGALRRNRLQVTETDQRRALLLPQEIVRLPPDEAILLRPGALPVRARRIRHYEEDLFRRLLRDPPAVEPIDIPVRMDRGRGFEPPAAEAEGGSAARAAPSPAHGAAGSGGPDRWASARPDGGRGRRKGSGPPSPPLPSGADGAEEADGGGMAGPLPTLRPHQADGLIGAILGAEVDLGALGLADAKRAVAAIVDGAPGGDAPPAGRGRGRPG